MEIIDYLMQRSMMYEQFGWGFHAGWLMAVLYLYIISKTLNHDVIFTFDLFGFLKKKKPKQKRIIVGPWHVEKNEIWRREFEDRRQDNGDRRRD